MRAVVTSGTGTGANLPGTPVYGKTTFDAKSRPGRSTAVCLGVDGLRSRPVRQRDVGAGNLSVTPGADKSDLQLPR